MKIYSYGLMLGVILGTLIVLSNVVFPDNGPDSSPGVLVTASLIGGYIVLSSYHASRRSKDMKITLKVGAVTSLVGFLLAMATFVVIDNLFLDIISKQSDKIIALQRSHYSSMRELVNWGLARGFLVGTPASVVFGLVCGFVGNGIPRRLDKNKAR